MQFCGFTPKTNVLVSILGNAQCYLCMHRNLEMGTRAQNKAGIRHSRYDCHMGETVVEMCSNYELSLLDVQNSFSL